MQAEATMVVTTFRREGLWCPWALPWSLLLSTSTTKPVEKAADLASGALRGNFTPLA